MSDAPPTTIKSTSDSSNHAALKVSGIEQLTAPGADTNYLDWSFVLKIHLQATNVAHVLAAVDKKLRPASWDTDNIAVCSVITRTIHSSNYRYIRTFPNDAFQMWESLRLAHQDSTSGGRMYWLRKLVQSKMTGGNVESHIEEMGGYAEKLNSLISVDNPLTADDVYSAALLISLPPDWTNCVSSLMNDERVPSTRIVSALKQESLRRKAHSEEFCRFTQRPNDDTLGAEEAQAACEKMQKPTTKENVGRSFMRPRGANPKDDLFGEREDLTKEGKAVKKLLMRKGEENVHDSDDEVRNPHASEDDKSDFEVVPPPTNGASAVDAKAPSSRSGTPGPGSQPDGTSKGVNNKGATTQATNLKGEKPQSRPPSRSGTPSLSGHSRANSATHPVHGLGATNRSRATSPQLPLSSSSNGPRGRADSPVLSSFRSNSPNAANTTTNGKRKQHPNGAIASKEKKLNPGPAPVGSLSGSAASVMNSEQDHGTINKEQIANLLRIRPLSTKELLSHFKLQMKQECNKVLIFNAIKEVAVIVDGILHLREGC